MTMFFYTLLLRGFAPLLWLWMRIRAGKTSREWEILGGGRFGVYSPEGVKAGTTDRVWVHAVSLGETRAAHPLIQALLERGFRILLTHTTPTGRAEGARVFAEAIASGQLRQAWLPYDFPGSMQRFLQVFKPRCGILIEREVWPNLIQAARRAGISVVLVSARFSESSLRQSRWARRILHRAYETLDLVLAQTEEDAERLRKVGAYDPHVAGNLKFDVALAPSQLEEGRQWRNSVGRLSIAIASTREGEEEMFARAIKNDSMLARDTTLYMLIPRHPQRFGEAVAVLEKHDLAFVRRSAGVQMPPSGTSVVLGDTLGEMAFYYAAADVAIIGGGFAPFGGQNLIEACAAGTPVIVGPHMHNFDQATQDAVSAGAAVQVRNVDEAIREAHALLREPKRREAMRSAALRWTAAHAGATQRIIEALRPWLGMAPPDERS